MGFVKLEETTDTYPELSIPFVGFYGDWNGTDSITPILSFLRNAEEVKYSIEDKEGNLVKNIRNESFVRKHYVGGGQNTPYSYSILRRWDGRGKIRTVEDGNIINSKAKIEPVDEDMEVKFFAHIEKEDRVHIKEFKGTIKKD